MNGANVKHNRKYSSWKMFSGFLCEIWEGRSNVKAKLY